MLDDQSQGIRTLYGLKTNHEFTEPLKNPAEPEES